MSLFTVEWEGAVNRKIRQSEDLPGRWASPLWTKGRLHDLRIKRDIPGSNVIGPGFFLPGEAVSLLTKTAILSL